MATVSPPPKPPAKASVSAQANASGADRLIDERIEEAQRALWWAELIRSSLTFVIAAIVALLVWLIIDQWIYSPGIGVRLVISLGLLAIASTYVVRVVLPLLRSSVRPEYAARSLERDLPELRQSLTSYVTLRGERNAGDLRSRVVRSIGSSTAGKLQRHDVLPDEATGTFRWWIATAVAFALLAGYMVASPKNSIRSAARLAAPIASIDPARRVNIEDVMPGDIEAIAGRMVSVSASVDGTRDDEEVICEWDLASGRESMVLSIDPESGRHSGELWIPYSASGSVPYTIIAGDGIAGPFRLRVQDLPVVALESVRYEPPKYTGQPAHTSSSGAITALDGTQVQIRASTNRPVAKAKIEFNPRVLGDRVRATAGAQQMEIAEDGMSLAVTFPLRTAQGRSAAVELEGYRVTVTDASGQSNPEPIIYPIRVVSDLAPEVSITMPFRSPKDVPVDSQQIIEVHASDPDYGLRQIRLEIRAGIDLIAEPVLWSHPNGERGNQVAEYRFRPSEHDLQIGATVQIVAIASDNRSSESSATVEPNVTSTDPVELKITASAPLPDPEDPNAGGLSEPDDRPASDHEEGSGDSGGDEGGEGEEQGGGGGSGGEGETGESQSGDNQSGDATSKSGEGGDESEGSGGGTGEESDDREGDGNQSDDSSSGNSSSNPSEGGADNENSTGESDGASGSDGQPSEGQDNASESEGAASDNPESGGDPNSGDMNRPESGTDDPSSSESSSGDTADGDSQTGDSGSSQTTGNDSGQSGDPSSSDNAEDSGDDPQSGSNRREGTDPSAAKSSDSESSGNEEGSDSQDNSSQGSDSADQGSEGTKPKGSESGQTGRSGDESNSGASDPSTSDSEAGANETP
ncbi:MAG: circumsporozoite protein- membrane associated protein, partial [Rubripirellula sp.]